MKKRLLCLFFAIVSVLSFSMSAFAVTWEDLTDADKQELKKNPYLWYVKNQMLGVEKGTGVTLVCPNGDYSTLYTGGTWCPAPMMEKRLFWLMLAVCRRKKFRQV